jgi:xanthine phosphoribosyltransferase
MRYYGYDEFLADMKGLLNQARHYGPDAIIAVARGGLSIGQMLAEGLDLRTLFSINSIHYEGEQKLDYIKVYNIPELGHARRVLVVDDIVDSGDTMQEVLRVLREHYPQTDFKVMTLFQKESAPFRADFWSQESDEWIDFFWISDIRG